MTGKRKFREAVQQFGMTKEDRAVTTPVTLGAIINGVQTVEVPDRDGFVYCRFSDSDTGEFIVAYNGGRGAVSPVYDLPVLVMRDRADKTRWAVVGLDAARYIDWGSSAFVARHGQQHSFNTEIGGSGDVTWVYGNQLMPSLVHPSGSLGAQNVVVEPFTFHYNESWQAIGYTGTANLTPTNNPTGGISAVLGLVYIEADVGNPSVTWGSEFSEVVTGAVAIVPFIPDLPSDTIPLAAIRLVTGSNVISWGNIYDLRPHYMTAGLVGTGWAGVDTSVQVQDEGSGIGSAQTLNFVGPNVDASMSGTVARIFISGGVGGGGGQIGIYGQDEGVPLGTGSVLNAVGAGVTLAISGSVLELTVDDDAATLNGIPDTGFVTTGAHNKTAHDLLGLDHTALSEIGSNTHPQIDSHMASGAVHFLESAISHSGTTGQTPDDHHGESHSIESHSGTSATGPELDELTDGSVSALHAHSGSYVNLDGTSTMTGPLDISLGGQVLKLGADDSDATTRTDNTNKTQRMGMVHYDNEEEDMALLYSYSNDVESVLNIGGGSSGLNAATSIGFYTATGTVNTTGILAGHFDNEQRLTLEKGPVIKGGDTLINQGNLYLNVTGSIGPDYLEIGFMASGSKAAWFTYDNIGGDLILNHNPGVAGGDVLLKINNRLLVNKYDGGDLLSILDDDGLYLTKALWLKELAAPPTGTSTNTWGRFWTKAGSPNTPQFSNEVHGLANLAGLGMSYDINTTKGSLDLDTPDDEFIGDTLDAKWTVTNGHTGTVDMFEAGNLQIYDHTTRDGALLVQTGRDSGWDVNIRQDYTLPDQRSITVALQPSMCMDGVLANNELQIGICLNSTDSGPEDAAYLMLFMDSQAGGQRIISWTGAIPGELTTPASGLGTDIYLRFIRDDLTYYCYVSYNGRSWIPLGSNTAGSAWTNFWLFTRCQASFGVPIPIQTFEWVREGGIGLDPW